MKGQLKLQQPSQQSSPLQQQDAPPSSDGGYRQCYGAELIAPDRTRFRLWAPTAKMVEVEIGGLGRVQMTALDDEGWFETVAHCGAGATYRYVAMTQFDGEVSVPDPASQAQQDDIDGPSVVLDHAAYQWRFPLWAGRPWHETVLYELHVGVLGGFEAVCARLPALAALGITAVELMPIADFPSDRNWGYDGVLPFAPEASYGTPDQLKALVDTAHGLGMMVFIDVVYNHFGPDGNYLNSYALSFFRDDLHTPWGKAIDFRRPEVRDFFNENALHWLHHYRVDGLRFDAVHAISEEDWLPEVARRVHAYQDHCEAAGQPRHLHLVLENDHNRAVLLQEDNTRKDGFNAQWNDDWHHVMHVLLTGEHAGYYGDFSHDPAQKLARSLSEGFVYQGEPSPTRNGAPRGEGSAHLPPTAFVNFLQNHDQIGNRAYGERLTMLANPHALRVAQALLLLSPQIPLLFMGEEYGATQPFLYFTSHLDESLASAVRDGRRKEFARFPAFADEAARAAIPDPNAESSFAASVPAAPHDPVETDGFSWSEWVAALLKLRRTFIVPHLHRCSALGATVLGKAAVSVCWRLGNGSTLAIAINLGDVGLETTLASAFGSATAGADVLFDSGGVLAALDAGELPAYAMLAVLEQAA